MLTTEPLGPQQPEQPDPVLAARTDDAARIYSEMEVARASFYDDDPAEGRGAFGWVMLSTLIVIGIVVDAYSAYALH